LLSFSKDSAEGDFIQLQYLQSVKTFVRYKK